MKYQNQLCNTFKLFNFLCKRVYKRKSIHEKVTISHILLITSIHQKFKMIRQLFIVFSVIIGFILTSINSKIFTIQFDEVKLLNSTYLEGYYNISNLIVTKFNRSTFVFNADFELLMDSTEDFIMDITFYSKRRAGMNWSKSSYYFPKRSPCERLELFKSYRMNGYNGSNMQPRQEDDGHCVFPKVCFC